MGRPQLARWLEWPGPLRTRREDANGQILPTGLGRARNQLQGMEPMSRASSVSLASFRACFGTPVEITHGPASSIRRKAQSALSG